MRCRLLLAAAKRRNRRRIAPAVPYEDASKSISRVLFRQSSI